MHTSITPEPRTSAQNSRLDHGSTAIKFFYSVLYSAFISHTANLLDLASSAPAPHNNAKEKVVNEVLRYNDLLKWDYEYEKSYWFDTSALMVSTTSNHQQHGALHSSLHNDSLGAAASLSSSSSSTASCSPPRIGRSFSGTICFFLRKKESVCVYACKLIFFDIISFHVFHGICFSFSASS